MLADDVRDPCAGEREQRCRRSNDRRRFSQQRYCAGARDARGEWRVHYDGRWLASAIPERPLPRIAIVTAHMPADGVPIVECMEESIHRTCPVSQACCQMSSLYRENILKMHLIRPDNEI